MKKFTLITILMLISAFGFSQTVTVIDRSDLAPVKNALLTAGNVSATTNALGQADISGFSGEEKILVSSVDFLPQTISYQTIELMNFVIQLTDRSYRTDEIVVSANKFDENSKFLPRQIEVLNARDIGFINAQNTAKLLEKTGNIAVQYSQQGGGSPILRGFEASRILLMIDGVRLNNAIFRAGHLQNILRIDENMLSRTEVIYGAGSTVYGSDALGGVVSFYTRDPLLSLTNKGYYNGNSFVRYSSANEEKTGHFNVNLANQKIGFIGSFTYSDFKSLRSGSNNVKNQAWLRKFTAQRINNIDTMIANENVYLQDPTGYNQFDVLGKILFKQSEKVNHTFNFQYSKTNDIPRYDRLNTIGSNGKFSSAEWYYGPEKRMLGSYKLNLKDNKAFYDDSRIVLAFQDIEESRHNRNFGAPQKTSRIENVKVYSMNVDFNKKVKMHNLSFGIEGNYNDVTSTAFRTNINTLVETPQSTRYPDGGSDMKTFAGYFMDSWKFSSIASATFGARYSNVNLNAEFIDTTFYKFGQLYPNGIEQSNSAITGNLGFAFLPKGDWKIYVNGTRGFRAPDVDDLAKIFETVKGTATTLGNVVVPNPELGPEYTYGAELGVSKIVANRVWVQAVGYYTWVEDAIVTLPFKYNGMDTIVYDGFPALVTANQNAQSGNIWGTSLSVNADLTNYLSLTNTVNYTYGRINTDSTDLPYDHIPPLYGKSAVVVNLSKFKTEFSVIYNAWKLKKDYNLSGEDNFVDATPDGMPNWFTLNMSAAYQFNKNLQLQLDINNILDRNYRNFASGISAPGLNSVLTLRGGF
ncbi:MAG: TonB-dependent receptor [bacterium]